MVRNRQGGAPGGLARGAVAVVTAWALAWAGTPVPVMALQDEGQAQGQAQAQAEGSPGESPVPAEAVAPQTDEAAGASVPDIAEGDEASGVADAAPADGLQTADDNIASGTCGECDWVIDSSGKLSVGAGQLGEMGTFAKVPWSSNSTRITAVEFSESTKLPQNCGFMFWNCLNLESIDVSSWNTSSVTSMEGMFGRCEALATLDVSKWNTAAVTNMSGLFNQCHNLPTLNVSDWDTSSATAMAAMFAGCKELKEIGVSTFNVSLVSTFNNMFGGCSSLQSVDVSKWDTARATNMNSMFSDCSKLSELDLSGWNTSAVTTSIDMFKNCSPAKVTLGQNYKMAGKAQFPEAQTGNIWKNKSGLLFTADQIMRFRSATADTYTQAVEPAGLIDISNAMVKRSWSTFIYDGTPKTPEITVVLPLLDYRTLNPDTDYTLSFSNNVNPGTATVTVTGKGSYKGTVSAVFRIINPKRIEMYRLYNPYTGEHFYTASSYERDSLSGIGWNYEGVGWVAPDSSDHPVYRLYNPYAGDHHYTTSIGERDALKAVGWNDEGTGWYSDDAHSVPLYRQYNPYATVGTHNYTASKVENDMLVSVGWNAEGIGWYGMK